MAKSYYNKKMVDAFMTMGVTVYFGLNMELGNLKNMNVELVGDYTLVSASISTGTPGELFIKRLFDIVVGAVGVVFTGLFYIIFARLEICPHIMISLPNFYNSSLNLIIILLFLEEN